MELETQKDILYWFVIVLVPIIVAVFGMFYKQTKDKERAENRLTKIESNQNNNINRLNKIEQEQFIVREELKTVKRIEGQNEMIIKMLDEMRKELRGR